MFSKCIAMDIDYFSNRKTLDSQNINIRTKLVILFKLNLPVLRLASQTVNTGL